MEEDELEAARVEAAAERRDGRKRQQASPRRNLNIVPKLFSLSCRIIEISSKRAP
jgi:hypothetical protein